MWDKATEYLSIKSGRSARGLFAPRYAHVVLVLCLDIALTVTFLFVVRAQEQGRVQAEFEQQANTYVAAIQNRIDRNLEVVDSIRELYAASINVERHEFSQFVQGPLLRHQEIQALSWNQRVKDSDRASYEAAIQNDGFPSFQITDRDAQGQMERAERRAEHISVTYIEPFKGNEAAMGFDVASNPARLKALERSRDTGEMVATGPITLVQEAEEQFGILILKPVYKNGAPHETLEQRRQNLTGFAVGVFRIGDMVETALQDLLKEDINIQLYDELSPGERQILFSYQTEGDARPVAEKQEEVTDDVLLRVPLDMPGRGWSLLATPTTEFFAAHRGRQEWWVLGGGLLISVVLMAYLISTIRHGARNERLAVGLSEANHGLVRQAQELTRSNEEMEQFVYVASHDLQEPLRMVTGYTQLLAKRYKGQLDADADEFIAYAMDGVTRMQELINGLLAYSRVSAQGKAFQPSDCSSIFDRALLNLRAAVQESGAVVTHDDLPTVMGDAAQLGQLFQNLIGNAIKFHGQDPPRVHVSAEREREVWRFSVGDNGIGIDRQSVNRIFAIFQRLHSRAEYPGTGIGLAICKRVVDGHGGRIWVESEPEKGSTFYFTIPAGGHDQS